MSQTKKKVSSNDTGLAYAEEVALGELPNGSAGNFTVQAFVAGDAQAAVTNIELSFNQVTKELSVIGTVPGGKNTLVARVNSSRLGNDVGVATAIGGDGGWTTSEPNGAVAQWDRGVAPLADSTATVIVTFGDIQDGDVLTVEFDNGLDFAGPDIANRSLTIVTLGTGETEWFELEPNSYGDFGGETSVVARNPINNSRQRKKGVVTDLEASGEFNTDYTQRNLLRLMQGLFFADAHEKATSNTLSKESEIAIVSLANNVLTLGSATQAALFKVGELVSLSGFSNEGNNTVARVTAVAFANVTFDDHGGFVSEPAPPANAAINTCGVRQGAGDCAMTLVGNKVVLTNAALDFTTLGLNVGEWIWIGGDVAGTFYAANRGYARIAAITANTLELTEPTWATPTADAGAALTIELYFGAFFRNEKDPTLIKCRSYQVERSLGTHKGGQQAEYLIGAIADTMSMQFATADKLNLDIAFMALRRATRKGSVGLKAGNRNSAVIEDAYNTSSDVYLIRMYVPNGTRLQPDSLFAYVEEMTLEINNNSSADKAIGVLGGFDINVGTFEVGGDATVYFSDVEALEAIDENKDVGMLVIGAKANAGFVFDMPLLTLGGGQVDIEQDEPVKLPLETAAAENAEGYTLSMTAFHYLPQAAMPVQED